ncbi:MAG: hypothetical protein K0R39_1123 [Symbiobacteriaceae bacterium]|jgi:O-acetyl-ADP-ribose deacetylase (regulator of RNase III)|nr:hypothetical protein [Symbiobacteriaceae bacterium]
MITYVIGNLFESPAQVLVNTVNTVGVMGKGIAKEFKDIYPDMFARYQRLCEEKRFDIGQLWLYKTDHKWVLNFPTKRHWRHPSRLEYIEAGLQKFAATYKERGITSIAFPMLGCGNGELDWDTQVSPLMERYLRNLLLDVYVYVYRKSPLIPEHRNPKEIKAWLHSEPGNLPFGEFLDDLETLIGSQGLTVTGPDFSVKVDLALQSEGVMGLSLQGDGWTEVAENQQLFEFWQQVRGLGFFTDDIVPRGLSHISKHLQALLAKLPYFRPAILSRRYDGLDTAPPALQLVAPVRLSSSEALPIEQVEIANDTRSPEA